MADQALVSSNDHHHLQKAVVRKSSIMIERKPLMLKDYLLDDLSSCSSNGFKSLPRRQCCSTVRFLLEIDLKQNHQHRRPHIRKDKPNFVKAKRLFRSSRSGRFTISVLQRASDAVINAVKQLPFPSVVTSVQNRARKGLLPRSLSRKLLNNRFWGRATDKDNASNDKVEDHHHEEIIRDNINRWRLYPQLPDNDHHKPSNQNTTTKTIVSSSSSGNSKSNSWCESEFTTTTTTSSSRQSETTPTITSAHENDVVGLAGSENDVSQKVKKKVDHITVGEEGTTELGPTTATCSHQHAKEWPNEEEKEQFSPVSVLDCPFEDDDQDETNSPFNSRLARLEGTKQKLLQKIRRFENLTQLEPVDLEKRIIAMSDIKNDNDRYQIKTSSDDEIEDQKARELVTKVTKNINTAASSSATNKLLFDFFRERVAEERGSRKGFAEAVKSAEDWTVGAPTREVLLRWEVNEGRKAYIKEMEKGGRWRNLDEEKGEIDLELEALVWDSLIEEILLDLL
ncbi:uncharacterized protein LOC133778321 isoform X2 [Humulus lupulus]|nr:uncharacterized protein LOC133778321 isoform X2 [Humulus lupulus]